MMLLALKLETSNSIFLYILIWDKKKSTCQFSLWQRIFTFLLSIISICRDEFLKRAISFSRLHLLERLFNQFFMTKYKLWCKRCRHQRLKWQFNAELTLSVFLSKEHQVPDSHKRHLFYTFSTKLKKQTREYSLKSEQKNLKAKNILGMIDRKTQRVFREREERDTLLMRVNKSNVIRPKFDGPVLSL